MFHKKKLFIFENNFTLAHYLIKEFVAMAEGSIKQSGSFYVALTGGKSIAEFYSKLSALKEKVFWRDTYIFLTDERFVPEAHAQSNFRMIKEMLLNDIIIPKENIYPIDTRQENVFLSAQKYEKILRSRIPIKEEFPRFDLVLLSLGEDGHVASLFPGIKEIEESKAAVVATYPEHLKMDRISLSMPVLNNAKKIICVVIGKSKAKALHSLIEQNKDIPGSWLNPSSGVVYFFADKQAASFLKSQDWEMMDKDTFFLNL